MTGQRRCLDCAAVLHPDLSTGELVDGWGERICGASYRNHVPDAPHLELGRPAAGTGPPAAGNPTGVGPGLTGSGCPASRALRLRLRVAARPPAAALDPGHPADPVSDGSYGQAGRAPPARLIRPHNTNPHQKGHHR
jgi:hypothetical protein